MDWPNTVPAPILVLGYEPVVLAVHLIFIAVCIIEYLSSLPVICPSFYSLKVVVVDYSVEIKRFLIFKHFE